MLGFYRKFKGVSSRLKRTYRFSICTNQWRIQTFRQGGGPGHPDPEIKGGGVSKKCFRSFGPQFGLKIKGGGQAPRAPPSLLIVTETSKIEWPLYPAAKSLSSSFLIKTLMQEWTIVVTVIAVRLFLGQSFLLIEALLLGYSF